MQKLIAPVLSLAFVISALTLYGTRSLAVVDQQAGEQQSTTPEQQNNPQASQRQGTSSAAVSSVTGCLVKTNSGYSLKSDTETYPIETDRDLSKYLNKQIKVTGILEHHNAAAPATENSNAIAVTDIRLRMVASVIGDCKPQ
jgi:hypothetical protein